MNLIIIGSGRMGIRHAIGAAKNDQVTRILLIDIKQDTLDNARNQLAQVENFTKIEFGLNPYSFQNDFSPDIAIIATPSKNRKLICEMVISLGVKHILIEKPLAQTYEDVLDLSNLCNQSGVDAYVNLNMRLYDSILTLKDNLNKFPQFKGYKIFSVNTGTLGIGANGIHYLDLLYFLLDADDALVVCGEIEDEVLPSGRGEEYCDFGGWSVIKFFMKGNEIGRAHLSMTSKSSVFGCWEILAPNGRITINEIEQERVDYKRKLDSNLPIYRYGADFETRIFSKFESPFLGDLTYKWINSIIENKSEIPNLSESLKSHKLLFDWLKLSNNHKHFSIT